jgi:D-alanyl-D-alanine carboxypeptidase/D-alanyl-D-alanine-endopeptidase (penicillin-binding protein 4)
MPMSLPARNGFAALLSLLVFAAAPAVAGPLPAEVETALDRAKLPREAIVVWVQEAGAVNAPPRLSWQPQQPVNPASLTKLVTTTAALDLLGPSWTWNTPVWLRGTTQNGVLDGDLVIKGNGDPKLVFERLWLILRRVQQLGVREIRGDIVIDRSAFAVPETNPGDFDGDALRPYNVGADALMINYKSVLLTFTPDPARGVALVSSEPPLSGVHVDTSVKLAAGDCGDWRGALRADFNDSKRIDFKGRFPTACGEKQWPVAYADPKRYNERVLQGLWREMGGRLIGRVREGEAPATPPTFEVASPTLGELVRDINKFSNNVMAQQLFLTLGATQRGAATPEASREALKQWMASRLGESAQTATLDNGSGLSRETRLSAQLLARVLQVAWTSPVMPELMSSLPISGIDGTMKRWTNSPAGRAHLKTGSLRDVSGIAGYVLSNSGRRYVLVAIVNHANANAAKPALDLLVQWTANDLPAPAAPEAAPASAAPSN